MGMIKTSEEAKTFPFANSKIDWIDKEPFKLNGISPTVARYSFSRLVWKRLV